MKFPDHAGLRRFSQELARQKAAIAPREFAWYPYNSIANVTHITKLLGDRTSQLFELAQQGPVLDIGTADGDLAFLLESLGMQLECVDNPTTNINGMRGLQTMIEARGSRIVTHEMDLDDRFDFPGRQFQLAFCLGLLYHLKNPLYFLETLAKHARYALLSTRVVANSQDLPTLAYLLDAGEMNGDHSNHWIFSTPGLRKALKKSKWEVIDYLSLPVDQAGDQRDFCFARSVFGLFNIELLEGWHELVDAGWRWTARKFSFRFDPKGSSRMLLYLFLHQSIFSITGPIHLRATLDGEMPEHSP